MGALTQDECKNFYSELSDFEQNGIYLSVEGRPASPMQVVNAHTIRENITYMRDYELDENGDIKGLCFYTIQPK